MISNTLNHKQLLKLTRGGTQYTSESEDENHEEESKQVNLRQVQQKGQMMRESGKEIENIQKLHSLKEALMLKQIRNTQKQIKLQSIEANSKLIYHTNMSSQSKNLPLSAIQESNFQTFGEHEYDNYGLRTPQKQGDSNYKSNIKGSGYQGQMNSHNNILSEPAVDNSLLQLDAEKYEQHLQEQNQAFERQYPQRVLLNSNQQYYQKARGDLQIDSEEYDPQQLKRRRKQRSDLIYEDQEQRENLNANQMFQKNSNDESDGQLERNVNESDLKRKSPKYIIIEREFDSQSSAANKNKHNMKQNKPFKTQSSQFEQESFPHTHSAMAENDQQQRQKRMKVQEYDYNDQYIKYIQQQKDLELEYQWRQRMIEKKGVQKRETKMQRDHRSRVQNKKGLDNQSESDSSRYSDESEQSQSVKHLKGKKFSKIDGKQKFSDFAADFYPERAKRGQRQGTQLISNRFEEQFIKTQRDSRKVQSKRRLDESSDSDEDKAEEEWVVKATKEGFLYFHIPGTKTFQWNFPRYYDYKSRKTKPYFISNWVKKYDHKGRKYWQNSQTKHIQSVKPDQETYLIQASIIGNLAFLECYLKAQGNLGIVDQQRRTALHHAVGNGHKEFTAILCNFGRKAKLIESQDLTGATPLFMAVRYNEVECLKILISFDCNIFHKMRNGDNCLHVAAAYNSLDSMVVVANFGGFELFMERNNQGRRPIDVAERMRNSDTFHTLQKLERNLMYQNAILEREIKSVNKTLKGKNSQRDGRDSARSGLEMGYGKRGKDEGYQTTGRHEARSRSKHAQKLRLDMISEEDQSSDSQAYNSRRDRKKSSRRNRLSSQDESSDSEAELTNLGGYKNYQRKVQRKQQELYADDHKKSYIHEIKKRKLDSRRDKRNRHSKYETDVPLFSEYDAKKRKFNKHNQEISESEASFEMDHKSSRLEKRKQQLSIRGNINADSFKEERDLDRTKNFFHLSIRDDSMIADPKLKKLQTARDMFLINGKTQKIDEEEDEENEDDEEKQASRNQRRSKSRPKTARENTISRERKSTIENAISKTSTFMKTLGGFFKGGIEKIKDYVFQEQDNRDPAIVQRIKQKNARSQSRGRSQTSRHHKDSELSDSSNYVTPRGKSQTVRIAQNERIESNSSDEDYKSTNERAIQREKSQKRDQVQSKQRKFKRGEVVPQQLVDQVIGGQEYDSRDELNDILPPQISQRVQYSDQAAQIAQLQNQNSSRKNRRVQPMKEDVMQQQSLDRSKSYGRLSKQNNTSSGSNNTGPHQHTYGEQNKSASNHYPQQTSFNPFLMQGTYQNLQIESQLNKEQNIPKESRDEHQQQLYLTRKKQKKRVIEEKKQEESLETSKQTAHLQSERPSRVKKLRKRKRAEDTQVDQNNRVYIQNQGNRASQVSLKSIGIGSTNVNETINTHTNSTGSNKLQHSRMIQREQKRRLGNQSKLLIQKNYQSSEDERNKPRLAQRSPSPAPRFMKEEVAYYKYQKEMEKNASQMQNAFQQVQLQVQNPTQETPLNKQNQDSFQAEGQQFNKDQPVSENKHFQLFSPASRIHSKQNSAKSIAPVAIGNQRYQRNQSTSLSGTEHINQVDINQISSQTQIPLRTQTQPLSVNRRESFSQQRNSEDNNQKNQMRAPNMLTQEQFDMIMLNSETEGKSPQKFAAKSVMPQNNQYKIIDSDLDSKKNQELHQQTTQQEKKNTQLQNEQALRKNKGQSPEDIKRFYQDLVKNEATLTKIEEFNNENGSQTIDESNLSLLYQKVMNKNKSQNQSQPSLVEEKKTNDSEVKEPIHELEFDPQEQQELELDEEQMVFNWESADDQQSKDEMDNLMRDFQKYDEISIHTVTDEENPPASRVHSGQQRSNQLNKGLFVGNSMLSMQENQQQQNTSNSFNKPLFFMGGLPNNSMQQKPTFMNPYQSDAESDYANKKRGKLGKLNGLQIFQHSPAQTKVRSNLIPPLLQKSTQSSFNPLVHPGMESERGLKEQGLQNLGSFSGALPNSAMRRLSFQSSDADQSLKPSTLSTMQIPQAQKRSGEVCEVVPIQIISNQEHIEEHKLQETPIQIAEESNLDSLSTIILNQNSNNTKDQKQMIELFLQDDEFIERVNQSPPTKQQNNFMNVDESKQNEIASTAENRTKAQNFILMDDEDDDDNMVQLVDDSKVQRAVNKNKISNIEQMLDQEDSETKRKFYEKLHQQFDFIEQQKQPIIQQDDSPKIFLKRENHPPQSSSNSSKGLSQENDSKLFNKQGSHKGVAQKKNTRYESEESLINMDISHSKLDNTLKEQDPIPNEDIINLSPKIDSRQSLKLQVKQQIQQYVKQSVQQNQMQAAELESVTLPLQKLQPAYKKDEIQSWSSEYHSLLSAQELQKALLGQMMVSAFSSTSSNLKLVKRHFLPYHGGANNTSSQLHVDQAATATANTQREKLQTQNVFQKDTTSLNNSKKEVQILRQSVSSMQSLGKQRAEISQDSIVQELDSISRIYDDLETVQEEEAGHTYDKTNTLEESKLSNAKSIKRTTIPKQQNRYQNIGADDDELEFDQDSQIVQIQSKPKPEIKDLFYQKQLEGQDQRISIGYGKQGQQSQFNNFISSDAEDQAETLAPNQFIEKQNKSTANAFLHNYLYTSSEDESKRKTSHILANARPRLKNKNMLHSSVNAPLYMHGQASGSGTTKSIVTPSSTAAANINISQALGQGMINMIQQKRSVRDVSFKSNNVSTHTEGSERLKENLKMIQKNRLFKGRQGNTSTIRDRSTSKEKFTSLGKQIIEQPVEESVKADVQGIVQQKKL